MKINNNQMNSVKMYQDSNKVRNSFHGLSSGKKINSAKDDAAGLAIAQKLLQQTNGLNTGAYNAQNGMSVTNIADGAMGSIHDNLQRIRELSVQASNGIYTDSDRAGMQKEIDGLMQGIQDIAVGTEFNTMKLLDGSMANMHMATNPDGSGSEIQMANTTLDTLGLSGYSVMGGQPDISAIDKAIDMVSSSRSSMGAAYNGLQSTYANNAQTAVNQTAGRSKIEDLDYPKAISDKKKEEVMDEYRNFMLRDQVQKGSLVQRMFQ